MFPESNLRAVSYNLCNLRRPSFAHIPPGGFHKPWMEWPSEVPKRRIPHPCPDPQPSKPPGVSLSTTAPMARPIQTLSHKGARRSEQPQKAVVRRAGALPPAPLGAPPGKDSSRRPPPNSTCAYFVPSAWPNVPLSGRAMFSAAHNTDAVPQPHSIPRKKAAGKEHVHNLVTHVSSPSLRHDTKLAMPNNDTHHVPELHGSPPRGSRRKIRGEPTLDSTSIPSEVGFESSPVRTSAPVPMVVNALTLGTKRANEDDDVTLRASKRRRTPPKCELVTLNITPSQGVQVGFQRTAGNLSPFTVFSTSSSPETTAAT